eukprot:1389660-Amorphochlora_amoeboformis.AAC.2
MEGECVSHVHRRRNKKWFAQNPEAARAHELKNFGGSTGIESYMRLPVEQYMLVYLSLPLRPIRAKEYVSQGYEDHLGFDELIYLSTTPQLNESMMERSDHDPNTFVLSVPKIRILSVWIQPEIQVSVTTLEDRVLLQGTNCRIDGSDIIMRMGVFSKSANPIPM